MKLRFLIFALALLLAGLTTMSAQLPDPKTVEVSTLSDKQILTMMDEIKKRGLSESDAMSLAKARGMSQTQIDQLKERMDEVKSNKNTPNKSKLDEDTDLYDIPLSDKVTIDSTKVNPDIFGFQFFNNDKLTFEPTINVAVGSSYVIGPGDELVIDIWGASQKNYTLKVDRNGNVVIPEIGTVNVGSLNFDQATKKLTQKLSLIYSDLNASNPRTYATINVGQIRAIKVNVIGEVFAPGTYTLPGTATAFNALYLCGGPNTNGSFREIHVIRDGKIINKLDVYDYLINANSNVNITLADNDIILVPTYLNRIKTSGEFKRNGIFEAKDNEKVSDIIKYTGGFTENAYSQRISIYSNNSRELEFKDVLIKDYNSQLLTNGDSIVAGKVLNRYRNRVSIEGAVFRPGNYELTEGLTLSQLVAKADGIREDAFLNRGLITRITNDLSLENISFKVSDVTSGSSDITLKREDIVYISSIKDVREDRFITISGEVQKPDKYPFKDNMSLQDLILTSGSFNESASEASIEIARRLSYEESLEGGNKTSHIFQFQVPRNLQLSQNDKEFLLNPFDQIFVRKSPGYNASGTVAILGEVKYKGSYQLSTKNERVSEIINRAGGILPGGFPQGAMLTRRVQITAKMKRLREELMIKDSTLTFSEIEFEIVGIDLDKIIAFPGSKADIVMKAGDELIIPSELRTIKVSGEVLNPLTLTYSKGKSARKYVNQAGGFGVKSKRSKLYVLHPNGVASSTKSFLGLSFFPQVRPGSEIIIPTKPDKEKVSASTWLAIGSTMASIGLTLATIVSLNKK